MTDLRKPLAYTALDNCGHLLFTSQPLEQPLEITGWLQLFLWVSSCDQEADLFCYLESFDPASRDIACVLEALLEFRMSAFRIAYILIDEDQHTDNPLVGMGDLPAKESCF